MSFEAVQTGDQGWAQGKEGGPFVGILVIPTIKGHGVRPTNKPLLVSQRYKIIRIKHEEQGSAVLEFLLADMTDQPHSCLEPETAPVSFSTPSYGPLLPITRVST